MRAKGRGKRPARRPTKGAAPAGISQDGEVHLSFDFRKLHFLFNFEAGCFQKLKYFTKVRPLLFSVYSPLN